MNFVYSIQYLDFFFVNKKKLFFSIDLCLLSSVSEIALACSCRIPSSLSLKKRQGQHFSEKSSVRPLSDWSSRRFEKPCLVPAKFDWLHSAAEEPPQPLPKILALPLPGPCKWSEIQKNPKQRCGGPVLLLAFPV